MRIIIDAMGGDNAPAEIVKGAVMARDELNAEITLVGREADITACLKSEGISLPCEGIDIVNATEVISMDEDPSTATRRKKDSSMAVALRCLSEGGGDAVVSAGSTGALLTGATLTVKRIKGIRRAALAPVFPNGKNGVMLIDCGANVECTPEYLLQFAFMGSFYSKYILGCENPRVALLNVGTEAEKGGALQKETYELLAQADKEGRINFIGNREGRDLLSGEVDVMVTDGFSGNIMLKTVEGASQFILQNVKTMFKSSARGGLAAVMLKRALGNLRKQFDVSEIGGTAMLGISKPVIKAHGSSNAKAICSAVRQAVKFLDAGIIREIEANTEYMKIGD